MFAPNLRHGPARSTNSFFINNPSLFLNQAKGLTDSPTLPEVKLRVSLLRKISYPDVVILLSEINVNRPTQATGKPNRNYGCFLVAASSFSSICPISGLDMKFFQASPVR